MDAKQAKAAIAMVRAIYEAIVEAGPMGLPSGPLYATLWGQGCSAQTYNQLIALLVESGKVRQENHVLYAVP